MHMYTKIKTAILALCALLLAPTTADAQESECSHIRYEIESEAVASVGQHAPFWLTNNRHGLSSLENNNAHLSVGLFRDFEQQRGWTWAYGAEVAGAWHHTSPLYLQQLYADLRYNCWELSIGSKERWSEGKNSRLSGGGLTFAPNARPIPQVRIGIHEYTTVPRWFGGWVQVKGHLSYGRFTDDRFMQQWLGNGFSFTQDALFHEKTGFIRIANPRIPRFSLEMGLEMYTQFGGGIYRKEGEDNYVLTTPLPSTFIEYVKAFIPMAGGDDAPATDQVNINGNQLGSWHLAANYSTAYIKVRGYYEHYFEDHSQMLGISWVADRYGNKRFLHYHPWTDGLYGLELTFPKARWVRGVVAEFITSLDQSGPFLHDTNSTHKEQISGGDNYYNHGLFQAWQHGGMGIGNPHFLAPLYNDDHSKAMPYNRLRSYHIGIDGNPHPAWHYRVLASYTRCWGSYVRPLSTPTGTTAALLEATYTPQRHQGWQVTGAMAMDHSKLIGNNYGAMVTLRVLINH